MRMDDMESAVNLVKKIKIMLYTDVYIFLPKHLGTPISLNALLLKQKKRLNWLGLLCLQTKKTGQ